MSRRLLLPLLLLALLGGLYFAVLRREEARARGAALQFAGLALSHPDPLQGQARVAPTCTAFLGGWLLRLSLAPWCPSPPGLPRRQALPLGEAVEAFVWVGRGERGYGFRVRYYRGEFPTHPARLARVQLSGRPPEPEGPSFLPPGAPWRGERRAVFWVPCIYPLPDRCGQPPQGKPPTAPPFYLPFYPSLGQPGEARLAARRGGVYLGHEAWVRLAGKELLVEGPGPRRRLLLPRNGVVFAERLVLLGGKAALPVTLAGGEVAVQGEVSGPLLGVLAEGSLHLLGARVEGHLLVRGGGVLGRGEVRGSLASLGEAPGVRVVYRPAEKPPPGFPRWPRERFGFPLGAVRE